MPVFELRTTPTAVEFWSDTRLQYEPKGEMRIARDALRSALRTLTPTGTLLAQYVSNVREFCDIENVLLYNVDMPIFSPLAAERIFIDRQFRNPSPTPAGVSRAHQHIYTTTVPATRAWRRTRTVGRRMFALPPGARSSVAAVWLAARSSAAPSDEFVAPLTPLALDVTVTLPSNSTLASAMKRLLDGLVSSFHTHDGSGNLAEIAARVATQFGQGNVEEIRNYLTAAPRELGTRRLIHLFRDSVQWNPADDWLVAVDLQLGASGSNALSVDATLSLVESAA